jgi:hypothetical protein
MKHLTKLSRIAILLHLVSALDLGRFCTRGRRKENRLSQTGALFVRGLHQRLR